jgi:YD repeat-containing protein
MADPEMGNWTYQVDALGEMLCQTDGRGQVTKITYDNVGRISSKLETAPQSDCTATDGYSSTWTYDASGALGLVASLSDTAGFLETYTYDSASRPIETDTTIDGAVYKVSTTYDNFGRVFTVTYPESQTPAAGNPAPSVPTVTPNPASGTQGTSV